MWYIDSPPKPQPSLCGSATKRDTPACAASPAEFIRRLQADGRIDVVIDGDESEYEIWADDVHSSKPHQQYADFLKSKMYRNERQLVTCSDCHDMHGDSAATNNNAATPSLNPKIEMFPIR